MKQKSEVVEKSQLKSSSKWYAPVGSAEYILNWFSGLTLTKYLSNECRVSAQRKQVAASGRRHLGVHKKTKTSSRAQPDGVSNSNSLNAVRELQPKSSSRAQSKVQGGVDFGLNRKNRVMDLQLCRSHLKTELDVLISHQNDLEKRQVKASSLAQSISVRELNKEIQPIASPQIIRLYQLVKRIEANNGRGVSAWPAYKAQGILDRSLTLATELAHSNNVRNKYIYKESNVDNALYAVSVAPSSVVSLNRAKLQVGGAVLSRAKQVELEFTSSSSIAPVSLLQSAFKSQSDLSDMRLRVPSQRLPIKAYFIAHFLATKLAAPKNKQSCMKITAKGGSSGASYVVRNAPSKNIAVVLDMLSAASKQMQTANQHQPFVLIGAKISCSGRLQGVEMAKTEWSTFGRIQSNTIDVLKDKGFYVAKTRYGAIGVSVSLSYVVLPKRHTEVVS